MHIAFPAKQWIRWWTPLPRCKMNMRCNQTVVKSTHKCEPNRFIFGWFPFNLSPCAHLDCFQHFCYIWLIHQESPLEEQTVHAWKLDIRWGAFFLYCTSRIHPQGWTLSRDLYCNPPEIIFRHQPPVQWCMLPCHCDMQCQHAQHWKQCSFLAKKNIIIAHQLHYLPYLALCPLPIKTIPRVTVLT